MGHRRLIAFVALAHVTGLAACGPKPEPAAALPDPGRPREAPIETAAAPATMADRVVADFETAIKTSKDAYLSLFDFSAVGELEILLHRYDLHGRLSNLSDDMRAQFAAEDGTPYSAERERINVGNFYTILGQRTVGSGGCAAGEPRTRYGKQLASYEELPAGTPEAYETLRARANAYLARGGVVGMRCRGGKGGLALVWTERPNPRGYELITIYDD
jgi:hypothetical protein